MTEPTQIHSRTWATLIALSALAAGTALGGCAHEDYYCDNTGCFYCDGVGCRPATPPTRTTCQGDWQCAAGQVCTSAGCATRCNTDSDCARGWVCRGGSADGGTTGLCVAPTEPTPTPHPGNCTSNAMCPSGYVCLDGTCAHGTTPACVHDTDCPAGNVCLNGACTPASNTCQFNDQCGTGRVCVNSQCRQACGASGEPACPTGTQCVMEGTVGYCGDVMQSGCVHDSDCGAGQVCLNSTCFQSCTPGSTVCPAGDYCSDVGICIVDTRPHPFCDDTHPCAAGSACVGGVCRLPCTTSTECLMHDVTYRNCGQLPGLSTTQNYCLTDDQAHTNCSRQSDCAMGLSCIDGVCQ